MVTRKDVNDLRKSLSNLMEVVDGLARKIGNTIREASAELTVVEHLLDCNKPAIGGRQRGTKRRYIHSITLGKGGIMMKDHTNTMNVTTEMGDFMRKLDISTTTHKVFILSHHS